MPEETRQYKAKRTSKKKVKEPQLSDTETLELELLTARDELIAAEAKLGELRAELHRVADRAARREALYPLKIASLEGKVEQRLANVENELALGKMYEEQVDAVLSSTTWRVGRLLVAPSYGVKKVLSKK